MGSRKGEEVTGEGEWGRLDLRWARGRVEISMGGRVAGALLMLSG